MEEIPFLGVATRPVDASLRHQLDLDPGFGLVVIEVEDGSGAEGTIEIHDVLVAFEDQLLVNHDQLSVLVRAAEAGKVVRLTLVRGGEEREVEVTLGSRKLPAGHGEREMGWARLQGFREFDPPRGPWREGEMWEDTRERHREMMERHEEMMDRHREQMEEMRERRRAPMLRNPRSREREEEAERRRPPFEREEEAERREEREAEERQEGLGVVYRMKDGEAWLTVREAGEGEILFDGPVDTEEQRAGVPKEAREILERLEERQRESNGDADGELPEDVL